MVVKIENSVVWGDAVKFFFIFIYLCGNIICIILLKKCGEFIIIINIITIVDLLQGVL